MKLLDKFFKGKTNQSSDNAGSIAASIQTTCSGLTLYCRDAYLPYEITRKYTVGMIVRERGFVDATALIGGIKTSHRYMILSNHMVPLVQFEGNKQWALCVADKDSRFLVLGKAKCKEKRATVLLHLNHDTWQLFKSIDMAFSQKLLSDCYDTFKECVDKEPLASVSTDEWLARCQFPIGMSDTGIFFPVDD